MVSKKTAGLAFVLALTAILFCTAAARADVVDPRIEGSGSPCTGSDTDVFSPNFIFTADASGGGIFGFCNKSSVDWTTLELITSGFTSAQITCIAVDIFTNCLKTDLGGGLVSLYFSGGIGVPQGQPEGPFHHVVFDLNCPVTTFNTSNSACLPWNPNQSFDVAANTPPPVPEPATAILIGSSALAALVRRRRPRT